MQAQSGLCNVQQHLGEEALSDTCYIYPRSVHKIDARFEQTLTLSCPEAARLALTQSDAFEFIEIPFKTRESTTRQLSPLHGFDAQTMDEARYLTIQLFQTVELTNVDRLILVGWLCNQLEDLMQTSGQAGAMAMMQELREMVESGAYRQIVSQLSNDPRLAANVFAILFGSPVGTGVSAHQRSVIDSVAAGLGFTGLAQPDAKTIEANYLCGLAHLANSAELVEKILARYLLNDLLRELFPWGQATPIAHYRRLLTRYGALRLMLAAVAKHKDSSLDESTLVHITQVFCRLYQHNNTFAVQAERLLTGADWHTLEQLYLLI